MAAAPPRTEGEGEGPFDQLVLHGVTLIDGTGAPPRGPVNVVIRNDRIASIRPTPSTEPVDSAGARVMDLSGMYVLPGFVDLHGHILGTAQGTPAEYVYKLWLSHGVTTVRDPLSENGLRWTLRAKERSRRNEIVAPRIFAYIEAGTGWDRGLLDSPDQAQAWVRWAEQQGADGIYSTVERSDIGRALVEAAEEVGIGSALQISQLAVRDLDALEAARLGLTTLEHWYGIPELLFTEKTIQDFPLDYNYSDQYDRFGEAGRLWRQAAPPESQAWARAVRQLVDLGLVLDPTLGVYEANRDLMRARRLRWHHDYTLPSLWQFFQPSKENLGSYWFRWTTRDEVDWKENFRIWMTFLEDYKNAGGSVCTGSDSGYIYSVFGFGFIRELEMLQEAGFHPLEVVRSATLCGAEALARPSGGEIEFGVVRPGLKADLVVVAENPIEDFKVLYGTGALRADPSSGTVRRTRGVRYTIKDGIVYDAERLRADVRSMVDDAWAATDAPRPGAPPSP